MDPQTQNYYAHYTKYTEVYRKLISLANDVKSSYQYDRDETDSIKEIIEILKSILIMESIEEYFSNNKSDLNYFMGEFSREVLQYILHQYFVYGENGNELALELLFHFVELFFKFHKNKEYNVLFENIRTIFNPNSNFYTPSRYKKEKNQKKLYTYQQFNEEYCDKFKKEKKIQELFKIGDKVDILLKKETPHELEKKIWIRGEITDIEDGNYKVRYPYKEIYREELFPIDSKNIRELGTMTKDWNWRLGLKKFDVVDCFDRGRWYPATVCRVKEFENKYGVYKEYKIGFRLYPDKFIEKYGSDTYVSNMFFWDNNNNPNDKEGNSYYGDSEIADEDISFYSKRIQKFQSFSLIQKEVLNTQYNNIFNNHNGQNNISINIQSQESQNEEKLKNMTEMLCYESESSIEDDLYFYEKDGKKNYILGKNNDEFKYYFASLLKMMDNSGCYEQIISFLKDKPNMIELYNIFYIIKKSDAYLHKDFFKENKELFKMAFFDSVEGLSSKDIKILQKEFIDYSINFLTRVNYIITGEKQSKKSDEIKFELSIKLIKSSIFDKKIQGLKMLTEYIKLNSDEKDIKYIIEAIKKYNIIKELFGSNYHTQIINKSNEILEFMLKNNELTEEDIKLIWSLTEQGDLEAKMTIIKLISDFTKFLNEKLCSVILNSINIEKITTFSEKEIDLIKNLAMKANDKKFIVKCCEIFCDKIFEINNLNILEKSPYVNIVVNFFEKDDICCKRIIDICEGNLKGNKNVLIVLFLLEKIIETNKKKIRIEKINEINLENDFINHEIYRLIDNNNLLSLFKNDFEAYKTKAKEVIKDNKMNEKNLMIDGYNHENNMKYRIIFLIKIIPILFPKFDFFSLLKEICLVNPIFESDKLLFYDFMEKFISDSNKDIIEDSSKEKIAIKEQLFNMLANENKNNYSLSQFNLYIKLFLDINNQKNFLTYFKQNSNYIIDIYKNVDIDDIFGIDKIWDLLFELDSENLSKKLINIIYSLYENKNQIKVLLDKCVNLIKDFENITYNKLEVCINIIKYIIKDSEKNGIIQIKSHSDLLKDCLISLNMEIKKKNNSTFNFFNSNKSNSQKNKGILYGNTILSQVRQILSEKYNMEEKDITINLKNDNVTTSLTDHFLNKNLKEIFNLNREEKRGLLSQKLKFSGNVVEKEYLTRYVYVNSKFENMIKEWFIYFTNGTDIMDKDAIINYISRIEPDKPADETNPLYQKLMQYDEGNKSCLLDDEFSKFYTDLAKREEETVWEHIKKMGYGNNLEKIAYSNENNFNVIDKNKLPRYVLGNDITFHNALIKLFNKFDKKMNIFQFLFLLSTNEKIYNELLDNSNKLIFVEKQENINYLEELYNLHIIKSFIQDLEAKKINLKQIFSEKENQQYNNIFGTEKTSNTDLKIVTKGYMPFDDEINLEKKRKFLIDLIEEGGYVKIIKNVEKTLESIDDNFTDEEKIKIEFCINCINLINLLYDSFVNKDKNNENNANDSVYFLFEQININQLLGSNEEKEKEKEKEDEKEGEKDKEKDKKDSENIINKLKEIVINTHYLTLVEKLIIFMLKFQNNSNEPLNKFCFKLFLKLVTSNQKLFEQIKTDEKIKTNITNLIKCNINNKERFFIQSLISYIRNLSSTKQDKNKLNNAFLIYLFEISNTLFNELIINKSEEKKSLSIIYFFEYFSDLLKEILKINDYSNITNILNEEFISQIYTLLYNDIKEKNTEKKLPEEIFLGIMKILITIMKEDNKIKERIINTKINNETLFDIIYNKLIPDNDKEEKGYNNNINEDDLDINNLLTQLAVDNDINPAFIKIDNLSEIIHLFNTTKKVEQEEVISDKVSVIFKNFIMACLTDCTNIDLILKLLKILNSFNTNQKANRQNSSAQKKQKNKKEPKRCGYVGLKNIGCICYMNSILQQMYMVLPFRNAIMSADDKKEIKANTSIYNNNFFDDNLLHQLQKMYTFLTFSEKQAFNPKDFCSSFKDLDGQPINIHLQQDSQEFYNNLCDKIESFLKKTKYKYVIDNIFTGKMCSSVICEQCNTISNRFEDFYNLSLEVKNINNLYDSLKKFIEPEKIEQFNCEVCKKKVTISKRTSLAKLPNVLFVHLKRFYMNYETEATEKINSKFEFPNTINLKDFCIEEITKIKNEEQVADSIYPKLDEYYEYELKGINVHLGIAEGGHYISFIDVERDGIDNNPLLKSSIENDVIKSRWLKFNDSIVTEFDTKDIPIESYGGFVDDNINNENSQNAYILIYERKKKTPIKIVIEKENEEKYLNNEKYKIVSFPKEKRNYINQYYDISYSNKEARVKEDELYNIIFKDEENDECYYYLPYYNIEKNVLKENFIEVMNKNKKFMNRSVNIPIDLSKYKDKWNEILFSIIHTKEFDILNEKFSINDQKQFVNYFKEEILDNKIYRESFTLDDEQKIILNDKANILLKKVIMPLINIKNKTSEIYDLLDYICTILTTAGNMNKIFECKNLIITGIFTIENVKLFCEVIYSIMELYDFIPRNRKNFKDLFALIKSIKIHKDMPPLLMMANSSSYSSNKEDENENKKVKEISGYYYLDLISKIFKINIDYIIVVNSHDPIYSLILKIKKNSYRVIRHIVYEMIIYLLEQYYSKKIKKINNDEKTRIQNKILDKNEELALMIFDEKSELLGTLLEILQNEDRHFSAKCNQELIKSFFIYAKEKHKVIDLLNILYKIINIKDEYTIDRLYLLMGFPNLIIKNKKPKILEEKKKEEEEKEKKVEEEEEEEKEVKEEEEKYIIFPKFGYPLIEENKDSEIYYYTGYLKLYPMNSILPQLFPSSEINITTNEEENKNNEQKLTEKERKNYIYKLLVMSLSGEGNYGLFKYIYLTQSRFIKYNNLYEEMLDILSQEKNEIYDLTEIKKNGEICIKRVNFEVNKTDKNISIMVQKNLDYNYLENEEKPPLPEMMEKNNNESEEIEEFTGFYPKHLPDKIIKVEYILEMKKDQFYLIFVNYYTTVQEMEKIKGNKNLENINQSQIPKPEENISEKNEIVIEEENEEDDEYHNLSNKIYYRNKIEDDEDKILAKLIKFFEQTRGTMNRIIIMNEIENDSKNKIKGKKLVTRLLLYSDRPENIIWIGTFQEKHNYNFSKYNYYYPENSIGSLLKKDDLLVLYRRNINIDFVKENDIKINIQTIQKMKYDPRGLNDSF